jgi:hypothetical protein
MAPKGAATGREGDAGREWSRHARGLLRSYHGQAEEWRARPGSVSCHETRATGRAGQVGEGRARHEGHDRWRGGGAAPLGGGRARAGTDGQGEVAAGAGRRPPQVRRGGGTGGGSGLRRGRDRVSDFWPVLGRVGRRITETTHSPQKCSRLHP